MLLAAFTHSSLSHEEEVGALSLELWGWRRKESSRLSFQETGLRKSLPFLGNMRIPVLAESQICNHYEQISAY